MEALKTKATAINGILKINVPEQFEGQELEVILLSADKEEENSINKISANQEKLNKLLSVIGTAKDMNKTFDKHDVYDQ